MATTTTNLGLTLPAVSDAADIGVLNTNFQLLDALGGYGLGEAAGKSCADCNEATENGYYQVSSSTLNRPSISMGSRCWMHVVSYGGTYKTQIAYAEKYMQMRVMVGGTWGEWMWVNPPMVLGVEYRTTERFNGQPVYCQLFNCGEPVSGSVKQVNVFTNSVFPVRMTATLNGKPSPFVYNQSLAAGYSWYATFENYQVSIYAGSNTSGGTVYVTLWYTKY